MRTVGNKLLKSKAIAFTWSYYRMTFQAYVYDKVFISQNKLLIKFLSVNLHVRKLKERMCT